MKKYIVSLLIIAVFGLLFISYSQYNTIQNSKNILNELPELEEKLVMSSNKVNKLTEANKALMQHILEIEEKLDVQAGETEIDHLEGASYLVEGEIELYAQIKKSGDQISKPAFGAIANLNPYAINIEKSLKVIEEGKSYSKVSLEGYIPTWYLSNDSSETLDFVLENKYIVKDTILYLTPSQDSEKLRQVRMGRAAKILYEWEEWYYVNLIYTTDANEFNKGWVHKTATGGLNDIDSIIGVDVQIRHDSDGCKKANGVQDKLDSELWGYILIENVDTFSISFPGAYIEEVDKSDVLFIEDY